MFHATLICSDGDCAETFEAWGTLEELEALACDCGCTLEILALDEGEDGDPRLELQLVR
jgi:hypothetical protein